MSDTNDLIAWYTCQLDRDAVLAASCGGTPRLAPAHGGEHWQWVDSDTDTPVRLDPVMNEHVNDGHGVSLRSIQQYPSHGGGTVPSFAISHAEEVPTLCGMHIVAWSPARVLQDLRAKRELVQRLVDALDQERGAAADGGACTSAQVLELALRVLAEAYCDRDGYRENWRAAAWHG